jgi:hypothetical protein
MGSLTGTKNLSSITAIWSHTSVQLISAVSNSIPTQNSVQRAESRAKLGDSGHANRGNGVQARNLLAQVVLRLPSERQSNTCCIIHHLVQMKANMLQNSSSGE